MILKDILTFFAVSIVCIMLYISVGFEQFVVMAFTVLFYHRITTEEREGKLSRKE